MTRTAATRPRFYFDIGAGISLVMVTNSSSTDPKSAEERRGDAANAAADSSRAAKTEAARATAQASGYNCTVTEIPATEAALVYGLQDHGGCGGLRRRARAERDRGLHAHAGLRGRRVRALPAQAWRPVVGARRWSARGDPPERVEGRRLPRGPARWRDARPHPGPGSQGLQSQVDAPYANSGIFGIQGGMRLGYHFTRSVGVVVTPVANLMFGNFLFALDLNAALRFAF